MYKNNYTPWHIEIYMYVVQMHIKSEVKSFEVRVYQVLHCFAHMVSIAVAYNICVFEANHLLSTNTPTRVCYSRVGLPVYKNACYRNEKSPYRILSHYANVPMPFAAIVNGCKSDISAHLSRRLIGELKYTHALASLLSLSFTIFKHLLL